MVKLLRLASGRCYDIDLMPDWVAAYLECDQCLIWLMSMYCVIYCYMPCIPTIVTINSYWIELNILLWPSDRAHALHSSSGFSRIYLTFWIYSGLILCMTVAYDSSWLYVCSVWCFYGFNAWFCLILSLSIIHFSYLIFQIDVNPTSICFVLSLGLCFNVCLFGRLVEIIA